MRRRDLLKDVGGLALYRFGPGVVARLGRRSQMQLADQLGDLVRRASADDVALMREELAATIGETEEPTADVISRAYRLRMFDELEVLSYAGLDPKRIRQVTVLEGQEHLDAALAQGRGAIVMVAHFGANQMVMPALGHRGYPMHQLSAPPTAWEGVRSDGRVNPLWRRVQEARWALEQALPAQHIDVFGFLRPAYRCLEANEVLCIAFDGGGGRSWIPVSLGRRTARVSTQPWQLARTTGAAVVPCFVSRHSGEAMHRVHLHAPWHVDRTEDKAADLVASAERFARLTTKWIERKPAQYLPFLLLRRHLAGQEDPPFFDDYP